MELYDFQRTGRDFLANRKKALLADEMGIGKSAQAINAIEKLGAYPCVVVCPSSVKLNWRKEFHMWAPSRKVSVIKDGNSDFDVGADVVIINYDLVHKRITELKQMGFTGSIFDELHYCKNKTAIRTKACKALASQIPIRFGLTGTPVLNRPVELSSQLKVLGILERVAKSDWDFKQTYCGAKKIRIRGREVWDFSGRSNLDKLNARLFGGLDPIALRRVKRDVLPQLPRRVISGIPITLNNWREYEAAEKAMQAFLIESGIKGNTDVRSDKNRTHMAALIQKGGLSEVTKMRKMLATGKSKQACAWIADFLETTDEKLVVFAHHKELIQSLKEAFGDRAVVLTGETGDTERQRAVDSFQNNPNIRLFLGNIQAAGTGITLTAASKVLFLEIAWSPGLIDQAMDRVLRIGQNATSVNIYFMVYENTLEEDVLKMVSEKKKTIGRILGE